MIRAHRRQFEAICRHRNQDLAAAMAAVVSQDGDLWTIDETHPAYPKRPQQVIVGPKGPGTELKKLLGRIGITASPTCGCNAKARAMDARGCDWCEEHIDTVVGWLREEAGKRRLPFLDAVGKLLVRRAISNARKEEARAKAAKEGEAQGPAVR